MVLHTHLPRNLNPGAGVRAGRARGGVGGEVELGLGIPPVSCAAPAWAGRVAALAHPATRTPSSIARFGSFLIVTFNSSPVDDAVISKSPS
jgi:hypothetical protein